MGRDLYCSPYEPFMACNSFVYIFLILLDSNIVIGEFSITNRTGIHKAQQPLPQSGPCSWCCSDYTLHYVTKRPCCKCIHLYLFSCFLCCCHIFWSSHVMLSGHIFWGQIELNYLHCWTVSLWEIVSKSWDVGVLLQELRKHWKFRNVTIYMHDKQD